MGGIVNSTAGFLGLSDGPQAPGYNQNMAANNALQSLNGQNDVYNDNAIGSAAQDALQGYGNGTMSLTSAQNALNDRPASDRQGMANALALDPRTGTKFATGQVMDNPILGQLFGDNGGLQSQMGILNNLQGQGFNLQPQDQTLYGQEAGQIANQFGQQANQTAQSLASRGLSSSGAAGAQFSGIAGNQNEMLAQAQQQIAQQRFQNTQNQIAQQQSFIGSLGQQGANDINQQYGRNASGIAQAQGSQATQAGLGQAAANAQSGYGLQQFDTNMENKPQNFYDMGFAGLSSAVGAGGKTVGQKGGAAAGQSMFGGSAGGGGMGAGGVPPGAAAAAV